jgi:hypothetical protein
MRRDVIFICRGVWFQLKSCMVYPLQIKTQLTSVSPTCIPLHPHLYVLK